MPREEIFVEIENERAYQDKKWGFAFDDKNTINDWAAYIGIYTAKAVAMGIPAAEQRTQLLKVASLAIAAIETFDRNGGQFASRHYGR
jgi:hypothetical protein